MTHKRQNDYTTDCFAHSASGIDRFWGAYAVYGSAHILKMAVHKLVNAMNLCVEKYVNIGNIDIINPNL